VTYRFIYSNPEAARIISGVNLDSRNTINALKNKDGFGVKTYSDTMIALVDSSVIFYKLETDNGTVAGFVSLKTNLERTTAMIFQLQLRPAFQQFATDISTIINNFIANGAWRPDIL